MFALTIEMIMIDQKTLHTLEFDKILQRLEAHASFSAGKEAVLALRPATELQEVRALLDQTTEARLLLETRPATHLGGAHDVRTAVRRAEVGSILTPTELLEIGSTLGASSRFRSSTLKGDLEIPWLRRQANRMAENKELVEALERTFSDRGEVLDSASPALRRIRSDIGTAQARLMERLNSYVTSAEHRSALQEPIVTMRNGRYVIPVRQDAKSKVPGVVHDQSASGQTIFIEPLAVTEMNNRLRELQLAEEREVERILQELSEQVGRQAPELAETVEALAAVDVSFAKARYATELHAAEPRMNDTQELSMLNARHPLLAGEVVPISVWLGKDFRVLVITGPNTGGKTVALKTVGLLTLMAQSGMHIPVESESEMAVFERVFADIGDEQSIEQSLSTFSSHMRTIISMLSDVNDQSLVLLDELGAGTDPAEGAALARALLITLLESGCRAVVTTHYSELKAFAHEQEGVENASVEFDVETLSPTYRLTIGLPGRSQALAIAKRLGMPERILETARQHVSAGAVHVEKLLAQIQTERDEIAHLFSRAKDFHEDARKMRDRLRSELRTMSAERDRVLQEAREEGATAVRELRARLRQIESEARGLGSRREQLELAGRVEEAQEKAAEALGTSAQESAETAALAPIKPGALVAIGSLGQQGTVISVTAGEAEVQVGQFKMRVAVDDLQPLTRQERKQERATQYRGTRPAPPTEVDIRGFRPDEAVREIDQYLHDNYMHGQGTVRIVHGKGTGALRKAIREQLSEHPLVQGHQPEDPKQGGEGVTVVKLAV